MSIQALYTAATGMNSMQTKLDVIANNLANAETTGFKADRPNFEDLFYRQEKYPGAQDSGGQTTPVGIATAPAAACKARRAIWSKARCSRPATNWTWRSRATASFRSKIRPDTIYYTRAGNFTATPTAMSSSGRPTSAGCSNRP